METQRILRRSSDHPAGLAVLEDPRGLVVHILTDIRVDNAAQTCDAVLDVWRDKGKPAKLVLNLTGVSHIDSAGVGTLMTVAQKVKAAGRPLVLCGLEDAPRRMLNRTGLAKLFQISDSVDEALRGPIVSGAGAGIVTALEQPRVLRTRCSWDGEELVQRRPHRGLWLTMILLTAILAAGGAYGYWAVETYRGRLDLLPAMQGQLAAAGQRIDAAETALQGWSTQRDAWVRRLTRVEARLGGTLRAARKEAEDIAARAERRMQAALDRRTGALESRVDGIEAAQQSADARIAGLQEQLDQLKSGGSQDFTQLHDQLHRQPTADRGAQRTGQGNPDLTPVRATIGPERVDFELGVNRDRQLVSGISLDVSHTDVPHQRFSGRIRLMPDARTLSIRGQGLQHPFVFYTGSDARPRELVITRVTRSAVVGYLLVPPDAGPQAAPGGAKVFSTQASNVSPIEGGN